MDPARSPDEPQHNEALAGCYFWCSDGLIVRDAGIGNMTHVLAGLIKNGDFTQILQRLDD
ncbi:hypothetical protein [Streptomyces sp. NPDC057616]|uniref:hypothetical protein n=1 Tax=Streptomyces sp. NPDC057616 TaxID=3346183 RepID=UPI0036C6F7C4